MSGDKSEQNVISQESRCKSLPKPVTMFMFYHWVGKHRQITCTVRFL